MTFYSIFLFRENEKLPYPLQILDGKLHTLMIWKDSDLAEIIPEREREREKREKREILLLLLLLLFLLKIFIYFNLFLLFLLFLFLLFIYLFILLQEKRMMKFYFISEVPFSLFFPFSFFSFLLSLSHFFFSPFSLFPFSYLFFLRENNIFDLGMSNCTFSRKYDSLCC